MNFGVHSPQGFEPTQVHHFNQGPMPMPQFIYQISSPPRAMPMSPMTLQAPYGQQPILLSTSQHPMLFTPQFVYQPNGPYMDSPTHLSTPIATRIEPSSPGALPFHYSPCQVVPMGFDQGTRFFQDRAGLLPIIRNGEGILPMSPQWQTHTPGGFIPLTDRGIINANGDSLLPIPKQWQSQTPQTPGGFMPLPDRGPMAMNGYGDGLLPVPSPQWQTTRTPGGFLSPQECSPRFMVKANNQRPRRFSTGHNEYNRARNFARNMAVREEAAQFPMMFEHAEQPFEQQEAENGGNLEELDRPMDELSLSPPLGQENEACERDENNNVVEREEESEGSGESSPEQVVPSMNNNIAEVQVEYYLVHSDAEDEFIYSFKRSVERRKRTVSESSFASTVDSEDVHNLEAEIEEGQNGEGNAQRGNEGLRDKNNNIIAQAEEPKEDTIWKQSAPAKVAFIPEPFETINLYVSSVFDQMAEETLRSRGSPFGLSYFVPPAVADQDLFGGQIAEWQKIMLNVMNFPHKWYMKAIPEIDTARLSGFQLYTLTAKLRFCCRNCYRPWTSMRGKFLFAFNLDRNIEIGNIFMKIYGQVCSQADCTDDTFQTPACYPEEIQRVLSRLKEYLGYVYYGHDLSMDFFKRPDQALRGGNPASPHVKALCQACSQGLCCRT